MKDTDRELLEWAAKAAGIEVWRGDGWQSDMLFRRPKKPSELVTGVQWNPLDDDGDALRLAVRRRFHITIFSACSSEGIDAPGFVEIWCGGDCDPIHTEYVDGSEYEVATRRAIVRAAAEIGKGMA